MVNAVGSVAANGRHAVVIRESLVAVEMFRIKTTYEALVVRYSLRTVEGRTRPRIHAELVFRGRDGHLPLDLTGKDKALAGTIVPEFFDRAGERREIPLPYMEALKALLVAPTAFFVDTNISSWPRSLLSWRQWWEPLTAVRNSYEDSNKELVAGVVCLRPLVRCSGRDAIGDGRLVRGTSGNTIDDSRMEATSAGPARGERAMGAFRSLNSPVSAVFGTRRERPGHSFVGPAGVSSFSNGARRRSRIQSIPRILRGAVLKEETDALRSGERRSGEEGRA